MDNGETREFLESSINSIIENYQTLRNIENETATHDEMYDFLVKYHGMDDDDFDELTEDAEDSETWLWQDLADVARERMDNYPLSIDDSHIWFTLGGPNISANVTGWSIDHSGRSPRVYVMDITIKGCWGGASVDLELRHDSERTGPAFDAIANMFEMNLLQKFGAY